MKTPGNRSYRMPLVMIPEMETVVVCKHQALYVKLLLVEFIPIVMLKVLQSMSMFTSTLSDYVRQVEVCLLYSKEMIVSHGTFCIKTYDIINFQLK